VILLGGGPDADHGHVEDPETFEPMEVIQSDTRLLRPVDHRRDGDDSGSDADDNARMVRPERSLFSRRVSSATVPIAILPLGHGTT